MESDFFFLRHLKEFNPKKKNMKTIKLILVLLFCAFQFAYSRPKPTHFAKRTCHIDCGQCEEWIESVGDPCLKTYYCVTSNGSTRAMTCQSWTWGIPPNAGGASDEDAQEVGAIFKNEDITVAIDENSDEDDIIFKAYLNSDLDESVIATTFALPASWVEDGWGYNISYLSGNNQLLIKVYPLVYENDSLFCSLQDENGGYSAYVLVDYLEGELIGGGNIAPRNINGVPVFSSDNIVAKIYPNPATKDAIFTKIEVPFAKSMGHVVTITDINGKVVIKNTFDDLENKINISGLENGIYMVKVEVDSLIIKQEKLLIQR